MTDRSTRQRRKGAVLPLTENADTGSSGSPHNHGTINNTSGSTNGKHLSDGVVERNGRDSSKNNIRNGNDNDKDPARKTQKVRRKRRRPRRKEDVRFGLLFCQVGLVVFIVSGSLFGLYRLLTTAPTMEMVGDDQYDDAVAIDAAIEQHQQAKGVVDGEAGGADSAPVWKPRFPSFELSETALRYDASA